MEHERIDVWGLGLIVTITAIIEAMFLTGNNWIGWLILSIIVWLVGYVRRLDVLWAKEYVPRFEHPGQWRGLKVMALGEALAWPFALLFWLYDQLKKIVQYFYRLYRHKKLQHDPENIS